ncbi:MAG: B12-binding domain-containing radical SAM protein [Elusimicrobiota bacterium]
MKVALVFCAAWDTKYSGYALPSLAAVLAARGHETAIFDLNQALSLLGRCGSDDRAEFLDLAEWSDERFVRRQMESHAGYLRALVDRVLSEGHRVVGFSVHFSNLLMSLEMARLFKLRDPGVVVVFGGTQFLRYERCLDHVRREEIDAVVYGEGDISFPRLIDGLERSGTLQAGPGVLLRSDPSTWKEASEPPSDLNALPFADFGAHRLSPVRSKVMNTTRGCVRKCDFCSEWRTMKLRQKNGDRIHAELAYQLAAHPEANSFIFGDSLVNAIPSAFEAFCGRMIREPLDLSWRGHAIVRAEMTRTALENARQSGCDGLCYGIESGSDRLRRRIGKNTPDDMIASVLRDTVAAGMESVGLFMVGHPAETEEDFAQTLDFIKANAGGISSMNITAFLMTEFEGREAEYGLAPLVDHLYWRSLDDANTYPIRIERVRLLGRVAVACGVPVSFDGRRDREIEAHCDESLTHFFASSPR